MSWSLPPRGRVKTVENEWIRLRDGTRLAARLWLPERAECVPVVLEYLPYRKRDVTRRRDDSTGENLAAHGIAFARVDIRGTGDSDGVLRGEYTRQEQADALEVIAWLGEQPWSSGAVGMRGISWGGFNTFQTAALQPPQLKAIMPCCFTDNQFTDDAHYYGAALSNPNYLWGTMFQSVLGAPPDPAIVGERWRAMWLERLQALPPILAEWTSHQRFDEHWKTGSVAVDYGRIRCPVYAVCGLNDHFIDVNSRVLANLSVPRKCLIGPWAHTWPDAANPGPGLAWVHEEVRWWEQWLKGIDTGIMDEPMMRVYLCHATAIEVYPQDIPGEWIAEDAWPSPRITSTVFFLNPEGLGDTPGEQRELQYRGDRIVGTLRGEPDAFFFPPDLPQEQTPDDQRSLLFDAPPLEQDLDVVGNPILRVRLRCDVPIAKLAARLTEVTPEGHSWMISSGILNLTHRTSHEQPAPLERGRSYDIEIPLVFVSQRLRAGNRLRIALSENFWPLVWPSPQIATLALTTAVSMLILPTRPRRTPEDAPKDQVLRDRNRTQGITNPRGGLEVTRAGPDAAGWVTVTKVFAPEEDEVKAIGTRVLRGWTPTTFSMQEGEPNSCRWQGGFSAQFQRGDWRTSFVGGYEVLSTREEFRVMEFVRASEADNVVFEREWRQDIKRDLM